MRVNYVKTACQLAARPEGFRPSAEVEDHKSLATAAQRLVKKGELFRLVLAGNNVRYFASAEARDAYKPDLSAERLASRQVLEIAARPSGFWPGDYAKSWGGAAVRLEKLGQLFRLQETPKRVRYFTTAAARDAFAPTVVVVAAPRPRKPRVKPVAGAAVPALRKALKDLRREKAQAARRAPQMSAGRPEDIVLGSIPRVRHHGAPAQVVIPDHVRVVVLPSHPPRYQAQPPAYAPTIYGHRVVSR